MVPATGSVLAYAREGGDRLFWIALNLKSQPQSLAIPSLRGRVVLSTHLDRKDTPLDEHIDLRPDEGVIILAEHKG